MSVTHSEPVPAVSVIVPHLDDLPALDRCLTALQGQTFADGFEIVVADNMSRVGLDAVAACIAGRARLVEAPDAGAGPARNRGVAASRAPVVAFIDSDCVAEPDWLRAGVAALREWDVVGGQVTVLVDHDGPLSSAEAFERVFAFDNEAYIRRKGFSGSGNLFCLRSTFDATGPFRTGMSEDLDWSHRATAAGFRLGYAPGAAVGHPARPDWQSLIRKWARIQRETFGLRPPTMGHRLRWLARAWAMPVSILAHLPRIWRSRALTTSGDRWRAAAGLVRLRLWRLVDAHRVVVGR